MPISSWSHSKMGDFESCKFRAWLKHDQKIPEPERPLPPGKTEHANDRGSRVHDGAELFVRGQGPFLPEMRHFKPEFEKLQKLFAVERVSLEGEWGMNQDWEPAPWTGAWLRLKLDALVFHSPEEATVIDYKTGKIWGNEIKHGEQTQLYQLVTFLRFPFLEKVNTELWYLDQDEKTTRSFTRDQGLRFRPNWDRRGTALTTCEKWPTNANKHTCKYCPYGSWGTGHCTDGVR